MDFMSEKQLAEMQAAERRLRAWLGDYGDHGPDDMQPFVVSDVREVLAEVDRLRALAAEQERLLDDHRPNF